MHWPQITYLAIIFVGFGLTLAKHGEPRTGNYSVYTYLVANALVIGLTYAGGFFTGGV